VCSSDLSTHCGSLDTVDELLSTIIMPPQDVVWNFDASVGVVRQSLIDAKDSLDLVGVGDAGLDQRIGCLHHRNIAGLLLQ